LSSCPRRRANSDRQRLYLFTDSPTKIGYLTRRGPGEIFIRREKSNMVADPIEIWAQSFFRRIFSIGIKPIGPSTLSDLTRITLSITIGNLFFH